MKSGAWNKLASKGPLPLFSPGTAQGSMRMRFVEPSTSALSFLVWVRDADGNFPLSPHAVRTSVRLHKAYDVLHPRRDISYPHLLRPAICLQASSAEALDILEEKGGLPAICGILHGFSEGQADPGHLFAMISAFDVNRCFKSISIQVFSDGTCFYRRLENFKGTLPSSLILRIRVFFHHFGSRSNVLLGGPFFSRVVVQLVVLVGESEMKRRDR